MEDEIVFEAEDDDDAVRMAVLILIAGGVEPDEIVDSD